MMRTLSFFVALGVIGSTAASAGTIFVAHQANSDILHGAGGTNIRSHGITVWTNGMPRSGFQVLGTIRDERTDKYLDGTAVKSAAIAKLARAHGGDAVLVRQIGMNAIGVERGGVGGVWNTPSFSDQSDVVVHRVTTQLVVIKTRI